jgi:hypothetical protein
MNNVYFLIELCSETCLNECRSLREDRHDASRPVHDLDANRIGEDHSTDRKPTTGHVHAGDSLSPEAANPDNLAGPSRAAIPMSGWCDDFGRLDISWLYPPDEDDSAGRQSCPSQK